MFLRFGTNFKRFNDIITQFRLLSKIPFIYYKSSLTQSRNQINVCIMDLRSSELLMLPGRIHLYSTSSDHLIHWAEVLHLLLQFSEFTFRNISLNFRLEEDIIDLVVLSSTFSPMAQVIVALNPREDDVAELHIRCFASQSSKCG
jgi:hypothetical protein